LKIIFAGTPDFAASALDALLASEHQVVAVLTQPDRPAGRGMQLSQSPVKQLAMQHGIAVMQPPSLKSAELQQKLAALRADVMVVAAYGLILPAPVLQLLRYGCLNIHASLLPRWRGAAPIQRAILAGDEETGITIMQMDEGLDTGAMLTKKTCPINAHDTAQILHDKLAKLGAQAIIEALQKLDQGGLTGTVQDATRASYASKLSKAEAQLDWQQHAVQLERAIRAYNPVPGAYSSIHNLTIKVWQASRAEDGQGSEPGTVLEVNKKGIKVACGQGVLYLEVLQKPGGKPISATQFVQGFTVKTGDRFTSL